MEVWRIMARGRWGEGEVGRWRMGCGGAVRTVQLQI